MFSTREIAETDIILAQNFGENNAFLANALSNFTSDFNIFNTQISQNRYY
jgi:hypothetical protein